MKSIVISIFLICGFKNSNSQRFIAPPFIDSVCLSKMAALQITYVNYYTGKEQFGEGIGILVNNDHILTAAHIFFRDSLKVSSANVIQIQNNKVVKTSINIFSTEYKETVATSHYDYKDFCTDYLILPLTTNCTYTTTAFDTSKISFNDSLYSFGKNSGGFSTVFVNPLFSKNLNGCIVTYFYGLAKEGFSGAPVYTKTGNIVGIIQGGFDYYAKRKFIEFLEEKSINSKQFDEIKKVYNIGGAVGYFLNLKSIINIITTY